MGMAEVLRLVFEDVREEKVNVNLASEERWHILRICAIVVGNRYLSLGCLWYSAPAVSAIVSALRHAYDRHNHSIS